MTLLIIYISVLILAVALSFAKNERVIKYKKWFTYGHAVSLVLFVIDVFMITEFKTSFRTVWVDRIIALCFFSSGAMTFALFSNTYRLNVKKLYFGFLFFYPLVASFVFLLDRLLFVLIASPLIFSLYCPTVYYSDYNYEIRRKEQIMAPIELTLIKKEFLLEKEIGTCTEIGIGAGSYRDLKILFQNDDSTNVSTVLDGKLTNLTFRNIKYN